MDANSIAVITGLGVQIIGTLIQGYSTFKKSNVEKYFEKLLESKEDFNKIGESEELQRYFFSIIDTVSKEANIEKIEYWKNATINLVNDSLEYDYRDNFLRTLDDLTVFDLTVLYKIYSTDFVEEYFAEDLINFFSNKNVDENIIKQAIKRLSTHNLVEEMVDRTAVWGEGKPILGSLYFIKNNLGKKFIKFLSTESSYNK